jgi:predicted  nucleic acid-binding Zn-ribbon protein
LNPQLQFLIELQKFDLRILEIQEQQQHIPNLIKTAQAPSLELAHRLKLLKEAGEALTKERRGSEQELSVQEEHIHKIRGRLNELKTNKEYQAHLFEIELARKKKELLEEAVLSVLERLEQNEKEIKELEERLREAEEDFNREKAHLESQVNILTQELSELERQHQERARLMDAKVLARYSKLKSARKGFAVAQVRDGTCSGCRLQIPPQLVAEVKRGDELLNCSYCHRILYWEAPDEKSSWTESPTEALERVDELR